MKIRLIYGFVADQVSDRFMWTKTLLQNNVVGTSKYMHNRYRRKRDVVVLTHHTVSIILGVSEFISGRPGNVFL